MQERKIQFCHLKLFFIDFYVRNDSNFNEEKRERKQNTICEQVISKENSYPVGAPERKLFLTLFGDNKTTLLKSYEYTEPWLVKELIQIIITR